MTTKYLEPSDELFAEIGRRLILLQHLEEFLSFAASVAFEIDAEAARESLLKEDKKTMGQLLQNLRKKCSLSPEFDSALGRTLSARNLLVHNLSTTYNLHTPIGQKQAVRFLVETQDDLERVSKMLKVVLLAVARNSGVLDESYELDWRNHADLNELERVLPTLNQIFGTNPKKH